MKYKSMTVVKSSLFPASKKETARILKKFTLLSAVAYPYISFKPLNCDKNLIWQAGKTFEFSVRLLGFIPFGKHSISVKEFNDDYIYTNEVSSYVPVWNHRITLEKISKNETLYTDIVEINAGWRTPFVYAWAKLFYAHRQRKWIKILNCINARR